MIKKTRLLLSIRVANSSNFLAVLHQKGSLKRVYGLLQSQKPKHAFQAAFVWNLALFHRCGYFGGGFIQRDALRLAVGAAGVFDLAFFQAPIADDEAVGDA